MGKRVFVVLTWGAISKTPEILVVCEEESEAEKEVAEFIARAPSPSIERIYGCRKNNTWIEEHPVREKGSV